jgi:hypothetical protein
MTTFNLSTLLKVLRQKKKIFYLNIILSIVFGLIVAFSIPKTYTSKVSMAAESQKDSKLSGMMGNLSSLAGINLGNSEDAISPNLYPDVVSTNKFLIQLLQTPVKNKNNQSYPSYAAYLEKESRTPWWTTAINTAIKGVKSFFTTTQEEDPITNKKIDTNHLTIAQETMVKRMINTVVCFVNEETDVITISVSDQDPVIAKQMVDVAQKNLQEFITEYRTNKARTDFKYYTILTEQLQKKYTAIQHKYAAFADSHMDASLKSVTTIETDLENEMQNAFTAYTQMKQQASMAEAKIQERTPVFTVIDDAAVPNRPTSPKKVILLIAFLFIGIIGTSAYYYLQLLFFKTNSKQRNHLHSKNDIGKSTYEGDTHFAIESHEEVATPIE